MTARDDDSRVRIGFKTAGTLEGVDLHQASNNFVFEIPCPLEKIVFGNAVGRRLAQILDQVRMAACLAQTKQQDEDTGVVG